MSSSVFPDINVWLAMTLRTHEHHTAAWTWYTSLSQDVDLVFCRFTQLSLLRLLTTKSVAQAAVMTQLEAWAAYDVWIERGGCVYKEEPFGLEAEFRLLTAKAVSSPKEWADSYLAAFARVSATALVTFDKTLSRRARGAVLLA